MEVFFGFVPKMVDDVALALYDRQQQTYMDPSRQSRQGNNSVASAPHNEDIGVSIHQHE